MLFLSSIYVGGNILLAYVDSILISRGEKILHGINGLIYVLAVIPAYLITKDLLFTANLFVIRRLVFDVSLNLFRGLPYNYTSNTTTSIIDRLLFRIQNQLGGIYYLILIISIVLLMK